jgi:hypothetical protein
MSFSTETRTKAVRKQHRCDACASQVETGQPMIRWAGSNGGDLASRHIGDEGLREALSNIRAHADAAMHLHGCPDCEAMDGIAKAALAKQPGPVVGEAK